MNADRNAASSALFIVDGHDIEMYESPAAAALVVEGPDAEGFDYFGADGTVYVPTVEGPEWWGPVRLNPTQENRLVKLVGLLRAEAELRGLSLPPDLPDEPTSIWNAVLEAQWEQAATRRSRWWKRLRLDGLRKG